MSIHVSKSQEDKSTSSGDSKEKQQNAKSYFSNNRPEATSQLKMQQLADNNERVMQLKSIATKINTNSVDIASKFPVVQLATLPIRHSMETDESYEAIKQDADFISKTQRGGDPLIDSFDALTELKADDKKVLHIVAHGNREQVADFNDEALSSHLESIRKYPTDFMEIYLHSCESGLIDDREGHENEGTTFAERMANRQTFSDGDYFSKKIIGMKGNSVTDGKGRSRVLKDPEDEAEYIEMRNRAMRRGDKAGIEEVEERYLKPLDETYDIQERSPWDD